MKFIITTAILTVSVSAPADAAEMPTPGVNECAIISAEVQHAEPTLIDPNPAAESMQIVVYCGHQVATSSGGVRTERALKVIDVDVEQAEVLVQAADDLLANGDVFTALNDG